MTQSSSPRQQLLTLLARQSFKLGDFQLSSGGRSDYYIDCRTTTLHAEGARLTGVAILELLHKHHLDPHAVGGLTLGADPIVSAVAIASAQHHLDAGKGRLIHGFLVRKAEKAHGTGRKIEGFSEENAPVLIGGLRARERLCLQRKHAVAAAVIVHGAQVEPQPAREAI